MLMRLCTEAIWAMGAGAATARQGTVLCGAGSCAARTTCQNEIMLVNISYHCLRGEGVRVWTSMPLSTFRDVQGGQQALQAASCYLLPSNSDHIQLSRQAIAQRLSDVAKVCRACYERPSRSVVLSQSADAVCHECVR